MSRKFVFKHLLHAKTWCELSLESSRSFCGVCTMISDLRKEDTKTKGDLEIIIFTKAFITRAEILFPVCLPPTLNQDALSLWPLAFSIL